MIIYKMKIIAVQSKKLKRKKKKLKIRKRMIRIKKKNKKLRKMEIARNFTLSQKENYKKLAIKYSMS
jgi:hypothetical protein